MKALMLAALIMVSATVAQAGSYTAPIVELGPYNIDLSAGPGVPDVDVPAFDASQGPLYKVIINIQGSEQPSAFTIGLANGTVINFTDTYNIIVPAASQNSVFQFVPTMTYGYVINDTTMTFAKNFNDTIVLFANSTIDVNGFFFDINPIVDYSISAGSLDDLEIYDKINFQITETFVVSEPNGSMTLALGLSVILLVVTASRKLG